MPFVSKKNNFSQSMIRFVRADKSLFLGNFPLILRTLGIYLRGDGKSVCFAILRGEGNRDQQGTGGEMSKLRIGVSSCLLGNPVRYDGQHKRNDFICDRLAAWFDFVPVCPEVECGLPVPREAMRLVATQGQIRLIAVHSQRDLTGQMKSYLSGRMDELAGENLAGFIFKKDSPSSGLERVKIYNEKGVPTRNGRGMFANAFVERFPALPVIEEGMLLDRFLRERFLNRLFTAERWRNAPAKDRKWLSEFQAAHKFMLMSHAPGRYAELGRLVETSDFDAYYKKLDELLRLVPTVKKHVNVLHHILGYFKKDLAGWEKQEVLQACDGYATGELPLAVPLTLLRHYVRKFNKVYLEKQTCWNVLNQLYLG